MKNSSLSLLLTFSIFCSYQTFSQQTGEEIFSSTCKVCHTIGQGKLIGPDLANVQEKRSEEWLLKFIRSSQTMINEGDSDAVAIFNEFNKVQMPDVPLSDDQIRSVLAYIASESPEQPMAAGTADAGMAEEPVEEVIERPVTEATEEDVLLGKMLYIGKKRFDNGGPSCISCHHVKHDQLIGGGRLAKDLTGVFSRMNEAGIKAIVSNPPFPAMRDAYSNGLVSDDEAFYLTAFLKYIDTEQYGQHPRNYQNRFLITGIVVFFVLLGCWSFLWRNRRKRAVNYEIFKRQISSVTQ